MSVFFLLLCALFCDLAAVIHNVLPLLHPPSCTFSTLWSFGEGRVCALCESAPSTGRHSERSSEEKGGKSKGFAFRGRRCGRNRCDGCCCCCSRVPFSFRSLTHSIIVQSISPHRLRRRSSQPTQKRNPTMAPAKKAVSVFFFLRVFGLRSRRPIAGVMLAAALSARINRFALLLCLPRRQEVSAVAVVECREILSKATVTASLKRATAF